MFPPFPLRSSPWEIHPKLCDSVVCLSGLGLTFILRLPIDTWFGEVSDRLQSEGSACSDCCDLQPAWVVLFCLTHQIFTCLLSASTWILWANQGKIWRMTLYDQMKKLKGEAELTKQRNSSKLFGQKKWWLYMIIFADSMLLFPIDLYKRLHLKWKIITKQYVFNTVAYGRSYRGKLPASVVWMCVRAYAHYLLVWLGGVP